MVAASAAVVAAAAAAERRVAAAAAVAACNPQASRTIASAPSQLRSLGSSASAKRCCKCVQPRTDRRKKKKEKLSLEERRKLTDNSIVFFSLLSQPLFLLIKKTCGFCRRSICVDVLKKVSGPTTEVERQSSAAGKIANAEKGRGQERKGEGTIMNKALQEKKKLVF